MDAYQHAATPDLRNQGADPQALDVKERVEGGLFENPDVRAVGMGEDDNGAPVIDVMISPASLPLDLPDSVDGVPLRQIPFEFENGGSTPALEHAADTLLDNADRGYYNPLVGGINIGIKRPTHVLQFAGTLGVVWYEPPDRGLLLSNYHVMFGSDGKGEPGDVVVQPEPGLKWSAPAAELLRGHAGDIRYEGVMVGVDCAIALQMLTERESKPLRILEVGKLTGDRTPVKNEAVMKRGYATTLTTGTILETNVSVRWEHADVLFSNQVIVKGDKGAFSAPGDSGSILVTKIGSDFWGVGLHWGVATTGEYTGCSVASPLTAALHALKID